MPIQLLYISRADVPVTPDLVRDILDVSRRNNAALGITGLLLVTGNTFVQVLEGEPEQVRGLVRRIRRDRRHRSVLVAVERSIQARSFGEWSMGFRELDPSLAEERQVVDLSRTALSELTTVRGAAILDVVARFAVPQPALQG